MRNIFLAFSLIFGIGIHAQTFTVVGDNSTFADPGCAIPTASLQPNGSNDIKANILVNGSTASSFQPGENIEKSFDGDLNTLYHSNWSNTVFPVVLNYRFDGTSEVDYMKYIPRADGGTNGDFGNVKIEYNTLSNNNFIHITDYDFGQSGIPEIINFPNTITPYNIKITVYDGAGNFASCAEMEFYKTGSSSNPNPPTNIFTDEICSELKPGVTQAQINAISSPFYKGLAQCLFDGLYDVDNRVREHEVYKPLGKLHKELKVSGYNPYENPTGIAFESGDKIALFVKDIPAGESVSLQIKDFEGGYYGTSTYYPLRNGLNVYEISNSGLGYISYYNDNPNLNKIKINIVTGNVNGVFDIAYSTNADWAALLNNTAYPKLDIVGEYSHLIYDKDALLTGNPTQGIELIQKYDLVNKYERLLMGLFKYDNSPKNRIMSFSEYGGGYYAGGLGIHLDWTWGIPSMADPNNLDLWGIPHEFGHVNQMRPDLRWIGTTEVTNNIYSVWVYYKMNPEGNKYTRLEFEADSPGANMPNVVGGIINGAINNTYVKEHALQEDDNNDVFKILVPFWQLELYYQEAGAARNAPELSFDYPGDYTGIDYARWYGTVAEVSRNTDSEGMTNGELAMNFVKNTCDAVQEDLTDFFIRTGFLRPIDIMIDDYGTGHLKITQAMVDDVIDYIQSKNYQQPVSPVINYISAHSTDAFKNQLPVSGQTGVGVSKSGNTLTIQNSEWPNAVAFETYNSNDELMHVAIVGTGDISLTTTKVYFPTAAFKTYAIGYDGQRKLVWPEGLSVSDVSFDKIKVYPNPIKQGDKIKINTENKNEIHTAILSDMTGKIIFNGQGSIMEIENRLDKVLSGLNAGVYVLNIKNKEGKAVKIKLIRQ